MSRTTMMLIDENGNTRDVAEFSNSWGSAAFVWDALRKAFLSGDEYLFNDEVIKKVWALWKDPRLLRFEKAVLLSTFDHAIIERDKFTDAAEAFTAFERRYRQPNAACHMGAISQVLMDSRELDCVGACFQQTSVAENPWLGEYDEETEEYKPFDMNAGKHFFVFAELQQQEAKQS